MSLLPRVRAGSKGSNELDTPEGALLHLFSLLPLQVWEPCPGNHALTMALAKHNITAIETYDDFLTHETWPSVNCRAIVTNPPFSLKAKFLARCRFWQKPWALLLPVTTLGARRCQINLKDTEIIFLPKRIDFTGKKAPWFAVMWVTQGLQIGRQMTFVD